MSIFWGEMVRRSVDMKRGAASTVHRAICAWDSSKLRPKFPMSSWGQRKGAVRAGLLPQVGIRAIVKHVAKAGLAWHSQGSWASKPHPI